MDIQMDIENDVLQLIKRHKDGISAGEIAETLGLDIETAKSAIWGLFDDGLISPARGLQSWFEARKPLI